jgi:hypothetical protein
VAFDAAGEHELAAKLDAQSLISGFDSFGGASLARAREARRALARGDRDRAHELAQKIVDAWGASDVPVPAVDDMRALLGKLASTKVTSLHDSRAARMSRALDTFVFTPRSQLINRAGFPAT